MIDAALQPLQQRFLQSPAQVLAQWGVKANQITLFGFLLGVMVVPALAFQAYPLALLFLLLNRLADGLDGAVARIKEPTDRGAFLDISCDFVFYALFPLGFALADPVNALPAAVLISSFVSTGSSFLAYAVIAAKRGETAKAFPKKGLYYLGGLTEGFETILLFVSMCLFPMFFPQLAYFFAGACAITALSRWYLGWVAFSKS
jgi:phosphatidylglycerophosphate synthase